MNAPFHLAYPIKNLEDTKRFYVEVLGCSVGRESTSWMDFNFYGHQITVHVNPDAVNTYPLYRSDNSALPVHHFGAVIEWRAWHALVDDLKAQGVPFLIEPNLVFQGEVGEQKSFFLQDPSGYAVEFKTFENADRLFSK